MVPDLCSRRVRHPLHTVMGVDTDPTGFAGQRKQGYPYAQDPLRPPYLDLRGWFSNRPRGYPHVAWEHTFDPR
jgi:hypothetical protein